MSEFKGVISKTFERGGKNNTKLYSFFLRGHSGLFKLGNTAPTYKDGAAVQFEANDKLEVDAGSIKPVETAPAKVADKGTASASTFIDHRAEENAARQRNINYQSAHKDAIELGKYIWDKELIKKPKSPTDQYDVLLALVGELTNTFYNDFSVDHTPGNNEEQESVDTSEEDE